MNENMDEVYKKYSYMLASFLKNKYPLTDQRLFYDNLKSMQFKPLNESLFYNVVGTYSSLDNTISFKEGFVDDKEVILEDAIGRAVSDFINLYPPGIPLLAPGECLDNKIYVVIKGYLENNYVVQGINNDLASGEVTIKVVKRA